MRHTSLMDAFTARQKFIALVRERKAGHDLGWACGLIAAEEYPDLDVARLVTRLEQLAQDLAPRLRGASDDTERLGTLIAFLRAELTLRGDTDDYYDPRNFFINEVIARGAGSPIGVAVVYMEVARRAGIPLRGVSFPAHFLMRLESNPRLFVDPFRPEEPFGLDGCRALLKRVTRDRLKLRASFLRPACSRQVLIRVLTNLKMAYLRRQDWDKAHATIDRLLVLKPNDSRELRARGFVNLQMQHWREAESDLERYVLNNPAAEDSEEIQRLIDQVRSSARAPH